MRKVNRQVHVDTTIPSGSPVIVTLDDGTEWQTVTRGIPWQLGHGDWVVSLEEKSGGYDLSRVRRAEVSA